MTTKPRETPASDPESPIDYDVTVVGGGAAGLSAAVFLARYGLETIVCCRGTSAIEQCAHLENYLGFPGGIAPRRFLDLGRSHATDEGATVVDEHVTAVAREDELFETETQDGRTVVSRYVLLASAYDADYLDSLESELSRDEDDEFLATEGGRMDVDGLYAAGWLTDETVHQAIVNAGAGARAALALARDDMSDRYWPAVGERYVDWVVDQGRYGDEGWEEHIADWFEREMLPADESVSDERLDAARSDLGAEFLDRCIDQDEQERRDRRGQRRILEHLDDEVVREYVASLDAPEASGD
jgi:threonine dehydrogenase-like Zn-dependent dehydrogenase